MLSLSKHELVERAGGDDIMTLITFHKDLFIMPIYNEILYY
jgi:hypothetical protein